MAKPGLRVNAPERIYIVEALRGIAALIVLLRHVCVHALEQKPFPDIFIRLPAGLAVVFFFVLSGIVLGMVQVDLKKPFASAVKFFTRRAARIYPLYWLVLGTVLFKWPELYSAKKILFWVFLLPDKNVADCSFQDIVPPAWSLHWEVFFYFSFAVFVIFRKNKFVLMGWILGIIAVNILRTFFHLSILSGDFMGLLTALPNLFFLSGLVVAFCMKRQFNARFLVALLLLGVGLTGWVYVKTADGLFVPGSFLLVLVASIGMGCVLLAVISFERASVIPVHRFSLWLGKISYPIYISNWSLMDLAFWGYWVSNINPLRHYVAYFVVLTVVSLAGGIALTLFFDIPTQKFLRGRFKRAAKITA